MTYADEFRRERGRGERAEGERPIVKKDVEARQGATGHHVRVVLGVGTVSAFVALMLLWLIFSL